MSTTPKYYVSSTWRRIGALLIDGLIFQVVLLASGYYSKLTPGQDITYSWTGIAMWMLGSLSFYVIMLGFFGGTPGKLALGLRIVGVNGSKHVKLSWAKAFLRSFLGSTIYLVTLYIAIAVAFFREDRRQLLDILAGTQVVQMRKRKSEPQVRWFVGAVLILLGISSLGSIYAVKDIFQFSNEGITIKAPVKPQSI